MLTNIIPLDPRARDLIEHIIANPGCQCGDCDVQPCPVCGVPAIAECCTSYCYCDLPSYSAPRKLYICGQRVDPKTFQPINDHQEA